VVRDITSASVTRSDPGIFREENTGTPEDQQVVWETEPGVRYEVQSTTNLADETAWITEPNYPSVAAGIVDSLPFDTSTSDAKFFRVVRYDEQAPAITERFPDDGGFAVGRFDVLSVSLLDVTGVDPESISLEVGTLGSFTLASPELSYVDGVLTFDNGGDEALGAYGDSVSVTLSVADTLGNSISYSWSFTLELEPILAGDVFVLGSPEAQRAGQQLTTAQHAVFRTVAPASGPIRMNAGAAPWTLTDVTANYLVFDYTGDTPPSFQPGQFLGNMAPANGDEVFYRKVVSTLDDTPSVNQITVYTEDVTYLEIFEQASLVAMTGPLAIYIIAQDGILVDTTASFSLGGSFTEPIDFGGAPVSFSLNGAWEYAPSLRFAIDIQGGTIEDLFFRYEGSTHLRVAPSITLSEAWTKTVTSSPILSSDHLLYLGQAGPVPIWMHVDFSLKAEAGVDLNAEATLSTAIEKSDEVYLQLVYSSRNPELNGWDRSPIYASAEIDPFDFEISGGGKVWAKLIPQVDARLQSLIGVYANITPEIEIDGNASFNGDELESASFDLCGRVNLNAGLSVIGFDSGDMPSFAPVKLLDYPWHYEYPEPTNLTFVHQPEDLAVVLGDTAVFRSIAIANAPVSYQWYHGGVPLTNQTGATLALPDVGFEHRGSYSVVAESGNEIVTSKVTLSVLEDFATYSNTYQTDFAGNTLESPWLLFTWGGSAGVRNNRLEAGRTDGNARVALPIPDSTMKIDIEFIGHVFDSYWGSHVIAELLTDYDSSSSSVLPFQASFGDDDYNDGAASIEAKIIDRWNREYKRVLIPEFFTPMRVEVSIKDGWASLKGTRLDNNQMMFDFDYEDTDISISGANYVGIRSRATTASSPTWLDDVKVTFHKTEVP
jgi:hypothetical protein